MDSAQFVTVRMGNAGYQSFVFIVQGQKLLTVLFKAVVDIPQEPGNFIRLTVTGDAAGSWKSRRERKGVRKVAIRSMRLHINSMYRLLKLKRGKAGAFPIV
jgi:hypothetical protein